MITFSGITTNGFLTEMIDRLLLGLVNNLKGMYKTLKVDWVSFGSQKK